MANNVVQTIKDAEVDARSLSEFLTKSASFMVTRRLAPKVHTLDYYLNNFDLAAAKGDAVVNRADAIISDTQDRANNAINQITADGTAQIAIAISNAGFIPVGTFAGGATLSKPNDVLQTSDGKLYRWAGSLPKTVPASSTPESTGGFGSNAWLEVSDASLAQKLSGLGGASTIGNGVSVFNNLAEFNASASKVQKNSKVYLRQVYQNNDLEGDGRVYSFVTNEVANVVNIATTGGFLTRPYDGKVFVAEFGCKPDDNTLLIYSSNSAALQKAFDLIRYYDGGVLSMGTKCAYPIGTDDPEGADLKDTVYGNVSNLDWQFNHSVINMRLFRVAWHPTAAEYGNHKNITISDAVYFGDSSKVNSDGAVISVCQQDFVHVDDLTVTGCTFIEANGGGHVFDLMGCRYVTIKDCEFLGSGITSRPHAEGVQLGHSVVNSPGNRIKQDSKEFFADLPTTHVYYKNNTCKPYINPTSGETTYPARPIGNHNFNAGSDIYITDNIFDNINPLTDTSYHYHAYILQLSGFDNIVVRGNVILSDNGNNKLIRLNSSKRSDADINHKPYFEISENHIVVKNPSDFSETSFVPIYFRYSTDTQEGRGVTFNFEGNDIDFDNSGNTAKVSNLLFLEYQNSYPEFYISKNKVRIRGNFDSFVSSSAHGKARAGGFVEVAHNTFEGTSNARAITLPENLYAENNKGTVIKIISNSFNNVWLPFELGSRAPVIIKDNLLINPSFTAQDGVTTSTFGFILVKKGQPVVLDGNIVVNPDPDNPLLKIGTSVTTPDVSEIRPVNS